MEETSWQRGGLLVLAMEFVYKEVTGWQYNNIVAETEARIYRHVQKAALCVCSTTARSASRYILKVYIAFHCVAIPPEHRVDGFCELGVVALVDATGVDLEVA